MYEARIDWAVMKVTENPAAAQRAASAQGIGFVGAYIGSKDRCNRRSTRAPFK
jgi:hypothetical protein